LVATQSISSLRSTLPGEAWRTLLQTFRTKIFLSLTDDVSAKMASDLCGRSEQMKESYALSESGQDAGVSVLTGKSVAHRTSISTSKTYSAQMHPRFEPGVFAELRNAEGIILAYDGFRPLPPQYIYMKPQHLDRNMGYFEQEARGLL
jgi:type IV secretory pathway TraG/TraD family ATPase VirD4